MITYKKVSYKIFALGPKFCWAGPELVNRLKLAQQENELSLNI